MTRVQDVDDTAWVRQAQAGDQAAFARLHAAYAPWVHAIALGGLRRDEVDDLVQEVFLVTWRKLPTLREPAAFRGWLERIARNRVIDARRRRRPSVELDPHGPAAPAPPTAEGREALDAILALPEPYRELLVLRLVEGWSGPEIAHKTGRSAGGVRVSLHRGLTLLRQRLGATPGRRSPRPTGEEVS